MLLLVENIGERTGGITKRDAEGKGQLGVWCLIYRQRMSGAQSRYLRAPSELENSQLLPLLQK